MGEFFSNVSRYPKYLITIILGVFAASIQPLVRRSKNPVTAFAVVGALVSGTLTLVFIVKGMVYPSSLL